MTASGESSRSGLPRFLALWVFVGIIPALLAYGVGALVGTGLLRGLGILSLDFWLVYRNVFRDIMIFGDGIGAFAFDLPETSAAVVFATGTLLAASLAHRRPMFSWVSSAPTFRIRPLLAGLVLWGLPLAIYLAASGSASSDGYSPPVMSRLADPLQLFFGVGGVTVLILLAAASEELVFRGWLLDRLRDARCGVAVAVVISSVLFAVAHREYQPWRFVDLTILGAALAWAAIRTGGLEWGIGLHTGWNLAIEFFGDRTFRPILNDADWINPGAPPSAELSLTGWAIYLLPTLVLIGLAVFVHRDARLRRLVGLSASAAAEPRPSA
ncbi:MAG: CPBP family intramembrane metalloprotease [Caulobacter sp.]|nr:CPBP family intramembrane metalloprotease [Caulobacter sp.]